jgi:hypothetical protein
MTDGLLVDAWIACYRVHGPIPEYGGGLAMFAAVALVRPVELGRVGKRRAQMIHNAIEHHPQEFVSRELAVVL